MDPYENSRGTALLKLSGDAFQVHLNSKNPPVKNGSTLEIAELELKLSAKMEKGMMGHERSMRPF